MTETTNDKTPDTVDTQAMPAPVDMKPDIAPPAEQVLDEPIPVASQPATIVPTGPSVPTIVFGVMGILVGAFGLLFGLRMPDVTAWMLGVGPQTITALFFGAVGVALIVIAVVWAIVKSMACKKKPKPNEPASL